MARSGSPWSTSGPTRPGCWSPTSTDGRSAGGRAPHARSPASAAASTSGTALRRGDRGRLRGGRRLQVATTRSSAPSGWWRSPPAPSATPPTARPSSPSCASASALDARLLDGEEEARLTYLGATAARAAERADPRLRHRRRLDRADRRLRARRSTSTPRCRPGSSATPSATSTSDPPDPAGARGARRRRPRADRGRRSPSGAGAARSRRSPSPARRPRWPRSTWSSSPTTPSGSTATASACTAIQRMLSRPRLLPLAERLRDRRACTPVARRRSSPAP